MVPELRLLRAFVAVAEELNFTRAANRMFVTQPALSHQIQRLEEQLSVTLFRRTSRQVTLTDDGERLLRLSKTVLTLLDEGLRELRQHSAPPVLRVGFVDYVGHTVIPERLRQIRENLPGTDLRQIEGSTREQLQGLQEGHLDVGFFVATRVKSSGVSSRTLWNEHIVLALPEGHPLTRLERVPVSALDGQNVLLNSAESNPDMSAFLHRLFHTTGIHPVEVVNPGARMYSLAGIMRLIGEGVGVFPIVKSVQSQVHPGVTFRPLCHPTPVVASCWRQGNEGDPVKQVA